MKIDETQLKGIKLLLFQEIKDRKHKLKDVASQIGEKYSTVYAFFRSKNGTYEMTEKLMSLYKIKAIKEFELLHPKLDSNESV
jgi:hypothetical protein